MTAHLEAQKQQQAASPDPSARVRRDRLLRAASALKTHEADFVDALAEDFNGRAAEVTLIADLAPSIHALKHAAKLVERWMKPQARRVEAPLGLLGAKARVVLRPKGVVGIMSPWNFPVNLTFGPLAGVLAAGNRAMIKPSELCPNTSSLINTVVRAVFDPDEVACVTGGADIAADFSSLPFDHLIYTGGGAIGRKVMKAAAENLTPLTLELGGRCPAIVDRGANLELAAKRIATGKLLNAGQVCLAPNHVWVAQPQEDAFVSALCDVISQMYPADGDASDYTGIIHPRHLSRLEDLIKAAEGDGATVIWPAGRRKSETRLMPALVTDLTADSSIMQEEIFGPILPILRFDSLDDVVNDIGRERWPLAIYPFMPDRERRDRLMSRTLSGGVCMDDCLLHFSQENLPFGGAGQSGYGAYHGRAGFDEFSHAQSEFRQIRSWDLLKIARPPYSPKLSKMIKSRW